MFKDMTLTPDGSYSTWNPGVNQKRSGIYKCNQQKSHVFQGSSFLALGFSRGGKHFNGITLIMTFDFSRISKTNLETSVEYLQRYFLNHPVRFFFLEQTTDRQIDILFWVLRYPAQCTGLELLPEPPQNRIYYNLFLVSQ